MKMVEIRRDDPPVLFFWYVERGKGFLEEVRQKEDRVLN